MEPIATKNTEVPILKPKHEQNIKFVSVFFGNKEIIMSQIDENPQKRKLAPPPPQAPLNYLEAAQCDPNSLQEISNISHLKKNNHSSNFSIPELRKRKLTEMQQLGGESKAFLHSNNNHNIRYIKRTSGRFIKLTEAFMSKLRFESRKNFQFRKNLSLKAKSKFEKIQQETGKKLSFMLYHPARFPCATRINQQHYTAMNVYSLPKMAFLQAHTQTHFTKTRKTNTNWQ
eukprot:Anaeramoba_ignava/a480929_480.p2 GENE.a480929_480~~a480929_480.p2  ORF type:complete len:229 (+),score=60.64 a480929_480:374-1060(+)